MGFLSSLTGSDAGKATLNALSKNRGLIEGFQETGNNIITTGEGQSANNLYHAQRKFDPYLDAGSSATSMYTNALGLNGADGVAAATGAFQTGPGYQFAVDEGMRGAERAASASGMLGSGNLFDELQRRGQGYANQEYGSWLDRLSGVSGQGLSAASGQAGVSGAIANLFQNTADNRLGLEGTTTQGLIGNNNDVAKVEEQRAAQKGSFLSSLLKTGISMGTKAMTGGLF